MIGYERVEQLEARVRAIESFALAAGAVLQTIAAVAELPGGNPLPMLPDELRALEAALDALVDGAVEAESDPAPGGTRR